MKNITLEELLEAGCHFGHQVSRQNPKTRDFVFEARDNIHIIDLEKTKEGLEAAAEFIHKIAQKPDSSILFLGTKRQAEGLVKEEVKRAYNEGGSNIFSVTARWIGGTMTNFTEVTKNYKKLKELEGKLKNEFEKMKYTKKEISLWEKERQKLLTYYGGTQDMVKIPDVLFVIDTHSEDIAVHEAIAMGIPVVGMVDTNADPDLVDYPIPANDDAAGSIKLILGHIIDAWVEGKKKVVNDSKAENTKDEKKNEAKEEVKTNKETKTTKVAESKEKTKKTNKESKAKKASKTEKENK